MNNDFKESIQKIAQDVQDKENVAEAKKLEKIQQNLVNAQNAYQDYIDTQIVDYIWKCADQGKNLYNHTACSSHYAFEIKGSLGKYFNIDQSKELEQSVQGMLNELGFYPSSDTSRLTIKCYAIKNPSGSNKFRDRIISKANKVKAMKELKAKRERAKDIKQAKKDYLQYIENVIKPELIRKANGGIDPYAATRNSCHFAFSFPVSINKVYMNDSKLGDDHLRVTRTELGKFVNEKLTELGFYLTDNPTSSSTVMCYAYNEEELEKIKKMAS